jgi:hypothetical protein
MKEAELTMLQRNKINYLLRQGNALEQPEMQRRKLPSEEYEMKRAREIMDRTRVVKKRSYEAIVKSGVFEIKKSVDKLISFQFNQTKKIIKSFSLRHLDTRPK